MNKDYYNFSYFNFETGKIVTIFKYNTQTKILRDGNNSVLKKFDTSIRQQKIEGILEC